MPLEDVTITTIIIGFKLLTLALGALVTYLSFKSYQRSKSRPLGPLAVGFAIITLGTFLAGIVDQVVADFGTGLLLESALLALGFLIITLSLYMNEP